MTSVLSTSHSISFTSLVMSSWTIWFLDQSTIWVKRGVLQLFNVRPAFLRTTLISNFHPRNLYPSIEDVTQKVHDCIDPVRTCVSIFAFLSQSSLTNKPSRRGQSRSVIRAPNKILSCTFTRVCVGTDAASDGLHRMCCICYSSIMGEWWEKYFFPIASCCTIYLNEEPCACVCIESGWLILSGSTCICVMLVHIRTYIRNLFLLRSLIAWWLLRQQPRYLKESYDTRQWYIE